MEEQLPLPTFQPDTVNDTFQMTLYRSSINTADSPIITLLGDTSFTPRFLPKTFTGNNGQITKYVIKVKNNISQSHDTTDFKFNEAGRYQYQIGLDVNCVNDADPNVISRMIIVQLMDENNNVYNGGEFELFKDFFPTSKEITLAGVVEHSAGDISKIGFIGFISNILNTKNLQFHVINLNIRITRV